jgi:hypothetical protein
MGTIFRNGFLVLHPAAFDLGRSIVLLGFVVIAIGLTTCFTGAFLIPTPVWFIAAIPTFAVGTILVCCSVTRL